jgi:hypothetical protein
MQMINPAVGGVNNRLPASVADTALRAARLFIVWYTSVKGHWNSFKYEGERWKFPKT